MKKLPAILIATVILLFMIPDTAGSDGLDTLYIVPSQPSDLDTATVYSVITIPNCCLPADSFRIETNLSLFMREQTQCNDPWHTGAGNTEDETRDSLQVYLQKYGIEPVDIFFSFDPAIQEVCAACDCLTGLLIYVYIRPEDISAITELDFQSVNDTLYDLIQCYHTEHSPACDCYCQCYDSAVIAGLEEGIHHLNFIHLFLEDPEEGILYGVCDTITFEVLGIPVLNPLLNTNEIFRIFPNPVSHSIHIEGNTEGCRYEIIDLDGRKTESGRLIRNTMDTGSLRTGTYILCLFRQNKLVLSCIFRVEQ
jgi:hypothetical protein